MPFSITPFQIIKPDDLINYIYEHPRRLHSVPVPSTLYQYYGLAKDEKILSEVLRVRISPSELEKIRSAANARGKTDFEYAREWIRSLMIEKLKYE